MDNIIEKNLLENRIIFLNGEVNNTTSYDIISKLFVFSNSLFNASKILFPNTGTASTSKISNNSNKVITIAFSLLLKKALPFIP